MGFIGIDGFRVYLLAHQFPAFCGGTSMNTSFNFGGDPKGRAARPKAVVHPAVAIHMDTGKPYGVMMTPLLPVTGPGPSRMSGGSGRSLGEGYKSDD